MPLSYLSNGLNLVGNIVNTQQINDANMKLQQMINQNNRELVATQNAQAKQEAELAYKRSSAPNQVALLTSAGMSRSGAINALNGGGSYTPAPVNTSQDSAAQMQTTDLSPLANIAQIAMQEKQIKQEERLQDKQIKAQAVEAQKQRDHELMLKDIDTTNTLRGQDLEYQKHLENLGFEREKWEYLAPLQKEQLRATIDNLKLDKELKEEQKRDIIYKINEYQSKENRDMRDAETLVRTIAAKYNYNISQKEFYDYRDKNYMPIYDNGEVVAYEPRRLDHGDATFSYAADRFWNLVGNILPVEYLGKIVKNIF